MNAKRILTLSPVFPAPLNTGTRVRLQNLLRGLRQQGHELGLISFITPQEDPFVDALAPLFTHMRLVPIHRGGTFLQKLPRLCRALPRLLGGMPPHAAFAEHPGIRAALEELAPGYDVLCVEFYFMAANVSDALLKGTQPRCILVEHDISFVPLQRRATLRKGFSGFAARLAALGAQRAECAVLRRFEHIIAMSPYDAAHLRALQPEADVCVVPNGVDCAAFRPQRNPRRMSAAPRLLFAGGLAHYPNLDAARFFIARIWPRVRAVFPQATLSITGSTEGVDTAALRTDGIRLTGFVVDMHQMYAASDVVICPYRIGGGTRLKILEALASGVPVVSTTIGAEGIALTHGEHALLADDPEGFAAEVNRLCGDAALAAHLAENGRVLAETTYDWSCIAAAFSQLLQRGACRV